MTYVIIIIFFLQKIIKFQLKERHTGKQREGVRAKVGESHGILTSSSLLNDCLATSADGTPAFRFDAAMV